LLARQKQIAGEKAAVAQAELEAAEKLKKREEKALAKEAKKQQQIELLKAEMMRSQQEMMAQFAKQLAAAQKGLESSSDSEGEEKH
jgi:hypothetical protein